MRITIDIDEDYTFDDNFNGDYLDGKYNDKFYNCKVTIKIILVVMIAILRS